MPQLLGIILLLLQSRATVADPTSGTHSGEVNPKENEDLTHAPQGYPTGFT